MSKTKTVFECQNCGAQSPRWVGRCPECQKWNTYVEEKIASEPTRAITIAAFNDNSSKAIPLKQINGSNGNHIPIGMPELDRVLGNGYVPGGATLIGGDPGIGKSTIVMQALHKLSQSGKETLYISGEESQSQIRLRAERMSMADSNMRILTENCIENIITSIKKIKPSIVVIDSIQTMYTNNLTSAPGTIGQVRESAAILASLAKGMNIATFIIGHVTKDGSIAGPKVLEHMVDTVLYFEGERGHSFRILRTIKNRFGSTNEIGVFEMTGTGLHEVPDPSGIFLAEKPKHAAGSVVTATLEGTRPMLLELQALVSPSNLGTSRRTSIGIDGNRIALLVAVLEKNQDVDLKGYDIFMNVAGGIRIGEPSSDLGVITAIHSSYRNTPVDYKTLIIGEVGLAGEVRTVSGLDSRLKEAEKMGFKRAIIPKSALKTKFRFKMEILGCASVSECLMML